MTNGTLGISTTPFEFDLCAVSLGISTFFYWPEYLSMCVYSERSLLNINEVTASEIVDSGCQIGWKKASRIVEFRVKQGKIFNLKELKSAEIVGEKNLLQLLKNFFVGEGKIMIMKYEKRNINTATASDLVEYAHGIGEKLAPQIVDFIKNSTNGFISSIDELRAIPYIGDKRIKSLQKDYYCGEISSCAVKVEPKSEPSALSSSAIADPCQESPPMVTAVPVSPPSTPSRTRTSSLPSTPHATEIQRERIVVLSTLYTSPVRGISTPAPSGKVNINRASVEEMAAKLRGIGNALATRIVNYRLQHAFVKIEDVMKVPYIKEGVFSKIKDDICV